MNILRNLYNWTLDKASHKKASWFLVLISFAESSFFPIPPDILLIPMILAKRLQAWFYALICTLSSVAGGICGYTIGYLFYTSIGSIITNAYGLTNSFDVFQCYYNQYGIWIVLGAGFTPFPFKVITIARGLRFYLIATLLFIYGNVIKNLIDKYFNLMVTLFFILLVGFVFLLKLFSFSC